MTPINFVHSQIYDGAIGAGASDEVARSAADAGVEEYKKGRYEGRPVNLILETLKSIKKTGRSRRA